MPPKGSKHSKRTIAKMRAKKSGSNNPMFGRGHSEETKDKIRNAKIGEKNGFYGKKHTEETRAKMSAAKSGDNNPMKRQDVAAKRSGSNNHNYGKPLSEETKRKLSIALSGEKHPLFGKPRCESTKQKISLIHKGKTFSESYRTKLVEGGVGGFWYGNVRYYDGPKYCEKWTGGLRERVRAFFGDRCVECGSPQNGRKLVVHHVWYNKKTCCDDSPRSLVPLCQSCHAETNFNRDYWSDHFQEMIDLYYDGKCWLTREEYLSLTKDINSLET